MLAVVAFVGVFVVAVVVVLVVIVVLRFAFVVVAFVSIYEVVVVVVVGVVARVVHRFSYRSTRIMRRRIVRSRVLSEHKPYQYCRRSHFSVHSSWLDVVLSFTILSHLSKVV